MNYNYINHSHKYFCKESNNLKKLRQKLYKILTNICDSSNNKKYEILAKFLVRRITIWKPTPYFTINLEDIPADIKKELGKLNDIELDILMNNLIEKIFRYSLRNKNYLIFNILRKKFEIMDF